MDKDEAECARLPDGARKEFRLGNAGIDFEPGSTVEGLVMWPKGKFQPTNV